MNRITFKAPQGHAESGVNIGGGFVRKDDNGCITVDDGEYPGLHAQGWRQLTPDEVSALGVAPAQQLVLPAPDHDD